MEILNKIRAAQYDLEDALRMEIDYEDAKKTAESLNSNGDYDKFLALLNSTHELWESVNKDLEANNIEAYKSYQPKVEELNDKFNEFINEYEF